MTAWLADHVVEILGVLFSLTYLVLSIRQNIWLWPVGIASAVMYIAVFYSAKFYADMSLNGYYFVISIYGWIHWSGRDKKGDTPLPVRNAGKRILFLSFLVFTALFISIALVLQHFTDSPLPWWDAFTTAGSIVATWMLAKKYLDHWLIWIVVDLVSMGLYIYKELYPTSLLFLVYTLMAVLGYIQWKRDMLKYEQQKDPDHRSGIHR